MTRGGVREEVNGERAFYAETADDWRAWLASHGQSERAVRLIIYHKKSQTPSVRYHEAVENALCFGWIDSKAISRDGESFYQRFTPRNPKSTWSPTNRARAERMIEQGLMTAPGQALIDLAKKTGKWDAQSPTA